MTEQGGYSPIEAGGGGGPYGGDMEPRVAKLEVAAEYTSAMWPRCVQRWQS